MEDAANPNLIVIGARNDKYREAVKSVYQGRFKSRINTFITDNKTAELVKYAMNGFFATKVVYANIIYDIAQEWGANYETIKNALYSSPNVAKNHMTIWYKGGRGVRGRCLPKDLEAFATWTDSPFLNEVLKTAKLVTKEESNGSL